MHFPLHLLLLILATARAQDKHSEKSTGGEESHDVCFSSSPISTSTTAAGKSKDTLPHILLVVLDDVGWADLQTFSSSSSNTLGARVPTMKKLWTDGVKLTHFYTQQICSPTRGALMTGRYPIRWHGHHSVASQIHRTWVPRDEEFLPELLSEIGYKTAAVGKWHLGHGEEQYIPTGRGFQEFVGSYSGAGDHYEHTISGTRFVDYHWDHANGKREHLFHWNGTHSTDVAEKETIRIIHQHNPDLPLFLYLPFQAPHTPTQVDDMWETFNQHVPGKKRRKFTGMISHVDQAIGRIVNVLKEKKMWASTLMITFSDNGGQAVQGASNYPLRGTKDTPFEGGCRVPAFLSGGFLPSSIRGSTFPGLIHVTDVLPTLRAALPLSSQGLLPLMRLPTKQLDGLSFWSSMVSGEQMSRRVEMLYALDPYVRERGETMRPYVPGRDYISPEKIIEDTGFASRHGALRVGKWKLVEGLTGRDEWFGQDPSDAFEPREWQLGAGQQGNVVFDRPDSVRLSMTRQREYRTGEEMLLEKVVTLFLFDLEIDPTEENNVATEYPEVVDDLRRRLREYENQATSPWDGYTSKNGNVNLMEEGGGGEGGLAQWYDFDRGDGMRRGVVDLWENPVEGATPIKQRMRWRQRQRRSKL